MKLSKIIVCMGIVAMMAQAESIYGFWLQTHSETFFIANDKNNTKAVLPNQVFWRKYEQFPCEQATSCIKLGGIQGIEKSLTSQIVKIKDNIIYKRFMHDGGAQSGQMRRRDFEGCEGDCVFEMRIQNKRQNIQSASVRLYKNPSLDSNVILDSISLVDFSEIKEYPNMRKNTDIDRIFFIAQEGDEANGFYQAIVIRNESLAFLGYIARSEIDILDSQSLLNLKYLRTSYYKNLFALQPSLQEIARDDVLTYPKQIHVRFDTISQTISIDSSMYPYLPITREIDYYLGEVDRQRLVERTYGFGEQYVDMVLRMDFDRELLSYANVESQVPLITLWLDEKDLQKLTSLPLVANRLCVGGQWLKQESIDIIVPSSSEKFNVAQKLSKFELVQSGGQGVLLNLGKQGGYYKIRYKDKKRDKVLISEGLVRKEFVIDCKDYDLDSAPDYNYAKFLLEAIQTLESKQIEKNISTLLVDNTFVGYRYEGFKNIKKSIEFAMSLKFDDLSNMPNGDKRITRKWFVPNEPMYTDFVFVGDEINERILVANKRPNSFGVYLIDAHSVVYIDTLYMPKTNK